MMKMTRFFGVLVLASTMFVAKSYAQEAATVLNQIHSLYGQRFDSNGVYIPNPAMDEQFARAQDQAVETLRAQGNLGQSFKITNNFKADLIITVTMVTERNGQFAGILIDRSEYSSVQSRAALRLFNMPILTGGMTVFSISNMSVANIKSVEGFSVDTGGTLTIQYPKDYKKKLMDQIQINVVKATDSFSFKTATGAGFTDMKLDVWVKLLSANFGITSISFR